MSICTVTATFKDGDTPIQGATLKAQLVDGFYHIANGAILNLGPQEATTDENGQASVDLVYASEFSVGSGAYRVEIVDSDGKTHYSGLVSAPDQATANLVDLVE